MPIAWARTRRTGCANGAPHAALSFRGHRRHARAPAFDSRPGAIDFAATLRAIAATGYDGWITVELYPYIDNPDSPRAYDCNSRPEAGNALVDSRRLEETLSWPFPSEGCWLAAPASQQSG